MTADVEIRGVTHRFGETVALRSVSLRLAAGEFAVLLGPSGCGKTTLLSVLGGFLTPAAGMVLIGGHDVTAVPPAKRPTTTVFQDYALFPHMTLGANVGFGLRMRGIPRAARDAKAAEMLRLVGLADAFHRRPHELSGGQRQRVALARALAVEPEVLLLDEPLGALDLKLRRQMQDELKEIQRRVGTTFVHVTHDQEEAMAIADRIVVMERGEIRDEGTPERVYLAPRSRFSAAFMGEANFVAGTLEAAREALTVTSPLGRHALPRTALAADTAPGRAVELCFRPEHLRAGDPPTGMLDLGAGTVADISFFGTHHRAHVTLDTLPGQPVVAHLPQSLRPAPGARIRLHLDPATVILLPVGGG